MLRVEDLSISYHQSAIRWLDYFLQAATSNYYIPHLQTIFYFQKRVSVEEMQLVQFFGEHYE